MIDELAALLHDRVDPSVWDGIVALAQALDIHEAHWYQDRIVALYNEGNNLDSSELVDRARSIVMTQCEVLLQQMGVVLDLDVVSLQRLAEIIRILAFIPSDLDGEALAALQQSEDTDEAFSEVLAVYLSDDPIESMESIVEISPTTLAAIREVLQANVSYDEQPVLNIQAVTARLHQYQQQIGTEPTIALESLHQGVHPGTSADELVNVNQDDLMSLSPEAMADELIALAILANIPAAAIRVWALSQMEAMIDDPLAMQKGYKRITARLRVLEGVV